MGESKSKPVWVGSSLEDLKAFPREVRRVMGFAIRAAEEGGKHPDAKPMKGFKGASVLEIVEDHDGDTYRAVYTVRFSDAVYVLHAFQKKSKKGIATPKHHLDLIRARLKEAEAIHKERTTEDPDEGNAKVHRKQRKRLR
jgi:phage-related protein